MKNIFKLLIALVLISPQNSYSQKKGDGLAIAAGILGGVASAAIAINTAQENLELFATNYIIQEYDFKSFELKINGLDDKAKNFDPSTVSILAYNITPTDYDSGEEQINGRLTLLVFLDKGWITDYGIDVTKVKYAPFSKTTWNNMIKGFISLASGISINEDKIPVYNAYDEKIPNQPYLQYGDKKEYYYPSVDKKPFSEISIERTGVESGNKIIIPFKKVNGDTYFVGDYSQDYKLIFNEKSLGIFLKQVGRLVQIKRSLINETTEFLNQI